MSRELTIGSVWIHFKGFHIATVIAIATHTETEEALVVYECYDNVRKEVCGIFARPLDMFLAEVDKQKFPDCNQKYRFERMN